MSKTSSKRKVLELYASAIAAEQKKLAKTSKKSHEEDSESDNNMECDIIEIDNEEENSSKTSEESLQEKPGIIPELKERIAKLGLAPEDNSD